MASQRLAGTEEGAAATAAAPCSRSCSFLVPLVLWAPVSYVPWLWHPLVQVTDAGRCGLFQRRTWKCRAPTSTSELAKVQAAGGTLPEGYARESGLSARAAQSGAGVLHRLHHASRGCRTSRGCTKAWATASARSSGASSSRRSSACRWAFCAAPIASSRGCRSRSSSSSATCPRRRLARCAWRFSASMTARRSRSSSSAPFSSRCSSSATPCARWTPRLIEAAQTLGAQGWKLVRRVVIPASITDIYTDMRILLGWAWTYLIVAEVVGTMSRHHLLHQPAGALPELRQRLRRHRHDRHHRPHHRHVPRVARHGALPVETQGVRASEADQSRSSLDAASRRAPPVAKTEAAEPPIAPPTLRTKAAQL